MKDTQDPLSGSARCHIAGWLFLLIAIIGGIEAWHTVWTVTSLLIGLTLNLSGAWLCLRAEKIPDEPQESFSPENR